MKPTKKQLLFITPSLESTGSEVLLFNFINFLAPNYTIAVLCFKEGSLLKELDKSVEVNLVRLDTAVNVVQKLQRRVKIHYTIPRILRHYKDYVWYINTIVLPLPVEYAKAHAKDFILHVHELKHRYGLLNKLQLDAALNGPRLLIANSNVTRHDLQEAGSAKMIRVIYPFIDLNLIRPIKEVRRKIAGSSHCWMMAGSIDENKNPLLFLKIAHAAKKQDLPYTFAWLYHSAPDQAVFSEVQAVLAAEQVPVRFIKTSGYQDYIAHLAQADGFLLTSSFESFSIVTLEALALDLPLVLNDCGGVREIVNERIASFIPLESDVAVYLSCMKKELERIQETKREKEQAVLAFDKARTLRDWEQLMLSANQ